MENIATIDWKKAFYKLEEHHRDKILEIVTTQRIITDQEAGLGRYFFSHLPKLLNLEGYQGNLMTTGKHCNSYGTVFALFDTQFFNIDEAKKYIDKYVENKRLGYHTLNQKLFFNQLYTKGYHLGLLI